MSKIGQVLLNIENIILNVEYITLLTGLSIDRAGTEPLRINRVDSRMIITRIILANIIYQIE
jgi:hypothetical protein